MSEPDRRPWLILSLREATALYNAAFLSSDMNEDLVRALRQIQLQTSWIESGNGEEPNVNKALVRDFNAMHPRPEP